MRRAAIAQLMLACGLAALASALGGCGASTETVTVGQAPRGLASTAANRPASGPTGISGATGTAGAQGGASGGTGTSSAGAGGTPAATTRTAPAPAFVEKGGGSGTAGSGTGDSSTAGLAGALEVVRAHGYSVKETSDYHPDQTLRVLVGTGAGSSEGHDRRAFFFLDGHYIGTDASSPSAQVSVVSQGDTEVTLAYALYRPDDPLCCPGAGQARVRFQLNDGRLVALDPIPPVSSASAPSRH
jgi:hypothetical protein